MYLPRRLAADATGTLLTAQHKLHSAAAIVADQEGQMTNASVLVEARAGPSNNTLDVKQGRPLDAGEEAPGHCKRHHGLHQPADSPALLKEPFGLRDRVADGACAVEAASKMPLQAAQLGHSEAEDKTSNSLLSNQEMTGFSGIHLVTASGKPIQQASKNLSRAANLFADLFDEADPAREAAPLAVGQLQPGSAPSAGFQLTTASGKKLEVGKAALERGQRFMSEEVIDAAELEGILSKGTLKRSASEMTSALDPATPGRVNQRQPAVALQDFQTAQGIADLPSTSAEEQSTSFGQRQGRLNEDITDLADKWTANSQAT